MSLLSSHSLDIPIGLVEDQQLNQSTWELEKIDILPLDVVAIIILYVHVTQVGILLFDKTCPMSDSREETPERSTEFHFRIPPFFLQETLVYPSIKEQHVSGAKLLKRIPTILAIKKLSDVEYRLDELYLTRQQNPNHATKGVWRSRPFLTLLHMFVSTRMKRMDGRIRESAAKRSNWCARDVIKEMLEEKKRNPDCRIRTDAGKPQQIYSLSQ